MAMYTRKSCRWMQNFNHFSNRGITAPANATARVQQDADWVTNRRGGDTAVREMIEVLLDAQGLLKPTENFFIGAKQ